MVHTVRDLALGLRPSMLDDFGLQPALEWLARDFTRRSNVPVELVVTGALDDLGDQHRTCSLPRRPGSADQLRAPRAGDAHQRHVSIANQTRFEVSVSDDGVGLDPRRRDTGFGLRGIEERVRELGGTVQLSSAAGKGATLAVRLPLLTEAALARAAG